MNKEKLEKMRNEFVSSITRMVKGEGFLAPVIALFALNSEDKDTLMIIPLDGDYLTDKKEVFLNNVVPALREKLDDQDFKVHAVCMASEAWARVAPKDFQFSEDAVKELDKEEIVIVTYMDDDSNSTVMFDMKRDGKAVNQEGEIIDYVTLTERSQEGAMVVSLHPEFDDLYNLLAK
jgi:hypothetical protein